MLDVSRRTYTQDAPLGLFSLGAAPATNDALRCCRAANPWDTAAPAWPMGESTMIAHTTSNLVSVCCDVDARRRFFATGRATRLKQENRKVIDVPANGASTQRSVGDEHTVACASEIRVEPRPARCAASLLHALERSDRCLFQRRRQFRNGATVGGGLRRASDCFLVGVQTPKCAKCMGLTVLWCAPYACGNGLTVPFGGCYLRSERSDRSVAAAAPREATTCP